MSAPWTTVLDEIEADLGAMEAALAARVAAPARPERSEPAGPLPDELASRAEALLARTRRLEARAEVDRDRIGSSLRALAGRLQNPERARTGRVIDVVG